MNERSSYERLLDKYLDGKHRNEKSASQDISRNYENSKDVSAPRPRSASGRKKTIMEMLQDGEFVAASKQIVSLYSSDTRPVVKNSHKIRASSTDSLRTKMKPTPLATAGPILAPGCSVEECHSALSGSVSYERQPPKSTSSYERYNPTFTRVPSYSIRSEKPPASGKETQFLCSIKNYIPNSKSRIDKSGYDARKKQGLYGSSAMSESKPIYSDPDAKQKSYPSHANDRINYASTHCDETDIRYFTPIKTGPEVGIQRKSGKRTEFDGKADQKYEDLKPEAVHYKTKNKNGRAFMDNVKYYTEDKKGNDTNIKMSTGMKWNNSFAEKSFQNLKVDYVRNNITHTMPRSVSTESYPSTDGQTRGLQRNQKQYLARNMSEEFTSCKDFYEKEMTKPAPVVAYVEYCTDRAPSQLDNRLSNDKQMDQMFIDNENIPSTVEWDERPQKRYTPEHDLEQQMKVKPIKFEVEGKNSSDPKYSVSINLTNKNKNNNKEVQQIDILVKQNPSESQPPTELPPLATPNENSPSFITIVPTTCISPYITEPNIEVLVPSICEKISVKIPPFLLYIGEQLNATPDSPLSTYSCYTDLSTCKNVSNAPDEPATLFTSVSPITSMSPYITGPCQLDSCNDTAKKFCIFGKEPINTNDRCILQEKPSINPECGDSPSCVDKIPIFYRFTDVGFECQMPNPTFNFQKLKKKIVPLPKQGLPKQENKTKVNYNNVAKEQNLDALRHSKGNTEDVLDNYTPTKNMSVANINSSTENKAVTEAVPLPVYNVLPEPALNMPLEENFIKIESPLNDVPHINLKMENGSQPVPICEDNYSINKPNKIPSSAEIMELIVSDVIPSGDSLCGSEKNSVGADTLLLNTHDWGDTNSLSSSQNTNITEMENVKLENSKSVESKCTNMNEINYEQKIELLKNYCESLNLAKDKVLQNISTSGLLNETKEIPLTPPNAKNSNYNLQNENKVPEPEVTSLFERTATKHKRKSKISASSKQMNSEEIMHEDTVKPNSNNTTNITELFKAANNIKSAYKTLITRVRDTNIRELENMENKIENILDSSVFVNEADISTTPVRESTKPIKHHHSKFAAVKDTVQVDQLYSESNTNSHHKSNYQVAEHNTNMMNVNNNKNVETHPNESKKNIEEKDDHEDSKTSKLTKTQCEKTSVKFVSTERVGAAGDKVCDSTFRSITTDFPENGVSYNNTPAEVAVTEKKEVIKMGAKKIKSKKGSNISFSCKGKNTSTDICDSRKKSLGVDQMTMDTDITGTIDFQTIPNKGKTFTQFPSFKTIPVCIDSTHNLKFEDISNYVMAIISVPSEAYEKKHCFTTRHLSHVVEHEIMGMDIDESNKMLKKIVNCEINTSNIPADNKSIKVPSHRSKCKDECPVTENKLSSNKKSRKVMFRCREKLPSESNNVTPCHEEKMIEQRSVESECKEEEEVAEVKEKENLVKDSCLETNQSLKSPKYDKKKTTSQILAGTKAIREAIVLLSGQNLSVNKDESQDSECNNSTDGTTDSGQADTKTIIDCAIKKVISVQSELNKTDVRGQDDGIRMLLEMRNKWCGLETRLDGMRFEHKKRERACDEKMLKLAKVKIERIRTKLNNIIRKNDDQNKKIDEMKDIVNCNINKLQTHQGDSKTMNLAVTAN